MTRPVQPTASPSAASVTPPLSELLLATAYVVQGIGEGRSLTDILNAEPAHRRAAVHCHFM